MTRIYGKRRIFRFFIWTGVICYGSFSKCQIDTEVLIFSGHEISTKKVIINSLALEYDIHTVESFEEENYEAMVKSLQPKVLLLLGDRNIRRYVLFQEKHTEKKFLPALAALGSTDLESIIKKAKGLIYLRYQSNMDHLLTKLDGIFDLRRIGTVFNQHDEPFIKSSMAKGIIQYAVKIQKDDSVPHLNQSNMDFEQHSQNKSLVVVGHAKNLDDALDALEKYEIQAYWVLNNSVVLDHIVLTQRMDFRKPVIVGIKSLIDKGIGNVAVVQDETALVTQIILELDRLFEDDWQIPLSKTINPLLTNVYVSSEIWRKLNKDQRNKVIRVR